MKNNIVLVTFGAVFVLVAAGCTSIKPLAAEQANYPKEKVNAHGLFAENCAGCHGNDGRAKTIHGWLVNAQNFTGARWQTITTDEEIIKAINTGTWVMPAFQKKLSTAEIEALAQYVRRFK